MVCGRIGWDDTSATSDGHPPPGVWFAECATHEFSGQRRNRRADALNDLLDHQAQFARHAAMRVGVAD